MKKLFILFFLLVIFLCSKEGSSHGESFAPSPRPAIVAQCPYCHTTSIVYNSGISRCSNCGNYFEVVPTPVVITAPPLVYTPPSVYDYPYYPRWWGPGFNLSFSLGADIFNADIGVLNMDMGILNMDASMDIINKFRIVIFNSDRLD